MASRELSAKEGNEARRVFMGSLQTSRVEISDSIGFGNRPWTSVGIWTYTLNLGPEGYKDAAAPNWAPTLIHELTHVWQGQNGTLGFGYMLKSVGCQCRAFVTKGDTSAAYQYEVGKDWDDYNVEQQASIVEDWYRNGLKDTDSRYRYIRDNIHRGKA
jgi:hypothetical protein